MLKTQSVTQHRYHTLDGLRGIAALLVAFHHITWYTQSQAAPFALIFVDVFFMLSGFVIAYRYEHAVQTGMSFRDFILRRIIRLYPLFLIGLCIGFVALLLKTAHGLADFSPEALFAGFVQNIFYIPSFWSYHVDLLQQSTSNEIFPSNIPAWSIFFEFLINIVFFFYVKWTKRPHLLWMIIPSLALILMVFLMHIPFWGGWGIHNILLGFPRVFFGFFTGMLIYHGTKSGKILRWDIPKLSPSLRKTGAFLGIAYMMFVVFWPFSNNGITAALSAVLISPLVIALITDIHLGKIGTRISVALGALSYPIYCLHFPLLHLLDFVLWKKLGYHANFSLWESLIILAAMSLVCWGIIVAYDAPLRRWLTARLAQSLKS